MKRVRHFTAFLLTLHLAVILSGCTSYSSVSERRIHFLPGTSEGRTLAAAFEEKSRGESLLAASLDCAAAAATVLRKTPHDGSARRDYNFAVGRVFDAIKQSQLRPWDAPLVIKGRKGDWQLTFKTSSGSELKLGKVDMVPADRYEFHGSYVTTRTIKDGIGAPLIVSGSESDVMQADRFGQDKRAYYGMTGMLHFSGNRCELTTEDPLATERVRFAGHMFPLAADFTAPLAIALAREKPLLFGLGRLLYPQRYAHTARIARLQPYDPKKIAVICIHGLLDSSLTWVPFINALRGDATIRKHFQFWFYSYPSGYPYPYSASILRDQLDRVNEAHPDHQKVVLIGHSMGGVISRTMITDSGLKLWDAYFDSRAEDTGFSPLSLRVLTDALVFSPRPEVGRVIFIAAPHRGSDFASGWIGRLGARLVRVPAFMLKITEETRNLTTFNAAGVRLGLMPNSIMTLTPNDRFVKTINTIPPVPGIPFHSIIGDRGKGGNKDLYGAREFGWICAVLEQSSGRGEKRGDRPFGPQRASESPGDPRSRTDPPAKCAIASTPELRGDTPLLSLRLPMPHEFTFSHRVEFSETDMAGIVHFANFFRMMENAEHAFFRSLGFTLHARATGPTMGWPRVRTSCDFLKPLRFEEVVEIQLLVAEVRTRSIRYAFRFWKMEDAVRVEVARGAVTAVCTSVDPAGGKLTAVPIPDEIRAAIQPAPADLLAPFSTAPA